MYGCKGVGGVASLAGSCLTHALMGATLWRKSHPILSYCTPFAPGHRFGEALQLKEQEWLVSEINAFLEQKRGAAPSLEDMGPPETPTVYNDPEDVGGGRM